MRTKLYFNENDKQNLSNLYNVSHENAVSSELQVFEDAIVIPPLPSDLNHNILVFKIMRLRFPR